MKNATVYEAIRSHTVIFEVAICGAVASDVCDSVTSSDSFFLFFFFSKSVLFLYPREGFANWENWEGLQILFSFHLSEGTRKSLAATCQGVNGFCVPV